jgi:gas vesicle protein
VSSVSLAGLAVGLAAGAAIGLLAAPARGVAMRASLRSHADSALERGMALFEQGRRVFRARRGAESNATTAPLTASLGEIAQMHQGRELYLEGQS